MDLRAARTKRALSLDALAARAGLTTGTLWRIERGLCSPSLRSRRLIAQALSVAPDSIDWPGSDLALGAITSHGQLFTKSLGRKRGTDGQCH